MEFVVKETNIKRPKAQPPSISITLLRYFGRYVLSPVFDTIMWVVSIGDRIKGRKEEWELIEDFGNFKLFREYVDAPDGLDYAEPHPNDIYVCHYKSDPEIPELAGKYFTALNRATSKNGIFVVSFNETGKGMTLWLIDIQSLSLILVRNIEAQWWSLSVDENEVIHLHGDDDIAGDLEKVTN